MTPEQFAYWLHGFMELGNGAAPTAEQWKSIREHLGTVFKKVTPPVAEPKKAAESDLQRSLREFAERQMPNQAPPIQPYWQPYWLDSHNGFPPGTIIC